MNILVLAYMLSPYKGSEFSVAWNYVTQMSRDNHLTVLYGISGKHMGNCDEMERYAEEHPMPNVDFVAVHPNWWANLLNWPNRHDIFVYTFYYAYRVWQKLAYQKSRELMAHKQFDLVHYVGMIGYREPGYLWRLGLPYIWGPVSGVNNAPWQLLKPMPLTGKLKQAFRSVANAMQFYTNRRLKAALRGTDVLLTATSQNQRMFLKVHHKESLCLPENCIMGEIRLNRRKFDNPDKYRLVMVGTLDARKSVIILLDALMLVRHKQNLHVDIVGGGPLQQQLVNCAEAYGLQNIIMWHGQLSRQEAVKIFSDAHLHVITSVSEGNPTTIWEAMSYGVPTMSFNHCGMHDTLCDRCGIRIPIAKTYGECVEAVAENINHLLIQPERFRQLAEGTIECAKQYTWEKRRNFLNKLYNDLLTKKHTL